jgi:hypothetical protein
MYKYIKEKNIKMIKNIKTKTKTNKKSKKNQKQTFLNRYGKMVYNVMY